MAPKRGGRGNPGATRKSSLKPARSSRSRSAAAPIVLAFLVGAVAAAAGAYVYLHRNPHPSAPLSAEVPASNPNPASRRKPLPPTSAAPPSPAPPHTVSRLPPFGTSEEVFERGAHLYTARCASCHGTPGRNAVASNPPSPQLWRAASHIAATRAPSLVYDQIALGNPAHGMPAYAGVYTGTQLWQLTLLLQNAGGDLPDPVLRILNAPPAAPAR